MSTQAAPQITAEFAKLASEIALEGLEYELPATKAVISAVTAPAYRLDSKSRKAKEIAWHIVWVEVSFLNQIADMNFPMEMQELPEPATIKDIIAWYDAELPVATARIRAMSAEQLATPINFYGMFNYPAFQYISFATKHTVHHRGQLAAALRPMGSKCPQIYGGSADFPMSM